MIVERLKAYANVETVVWAQEEPKNNGAWFFVDALIEQVLIAAGGATQRPIYAGRAASAATATGLAKRHARPSRRHSSRPRSGTIRIR